MNKLQHMARLLLAAVLGTSLVAHAAEGMWTLDNLPKAQLQAQYGFTPDAAWVDKVMHAAVRLAGGCSGSFVSRDGLVMTNHHCVRGCVAQLSNAQRNLIELGFLARTRDAEVRCPEMELNRLEQVSDVTDQVQAATRGLEGEAYKQAQNAVRARLTSACVGEDKNMTRCDLVDLYHGGQFKLYRYHRFNDARLVWAPEDAIASFGGDPDNFNFPRFDLDAAFVRAYENGKPVAVKDFFAFKPAGAAAGELTFTAGNPGSTRRLLTVAQLDNDRDQRLLRGLISLSELRGVLMQYSKQSPEAARQAQGMLFGIENSLKVLTGEIFALQSPDLLKRKRAEEDALKAYVMASPALKASTGGAWAAIEQALQRGRDMADAYETIGTDRALMTRYFAIARTLVRGAAERSKPNAERLPEFNDARLPQVEQGLFSPAPIYPGFEILKLDWSLNKMRERLGPDDPVVKQVLGQESPAQLAERMVKGSQLADISVRRALWTGGAAAIAQSTDPFIQMAVALDPVSRSLRQRYEAEVDAAIARNAQSIAQARFAQLGTSVYPDATFSLRLSYGEVRGWPEKGQPVAPFTTMGGAFARATGAEPFALPPSWLASRQQLNAAQPFNFSSTNDIIGGNSGSPVINRNAEVVGLAFDGNVHSHGGAYFYDPALNRTVSVHAGAIVESLRTVYKADALLDELLAH